MKILFYFVSFNIALFSTNNLFADEKRPEHFKGKPAATLEQAIKNFTAYNHKLQGILASELTPEKMAEIHQLSYTLENALEKIDDEVDQLKDALEHVHLGSEHMDYNKVKQQGRLYLENAAKLIKP